RVGSIEGVGTRAEIAAAEAALAALPAGFEAETEFTIFDDGSPMTLNAIKDASGTILSGKLPFGARPSDLGLPTFPEAITIAEIEGPTPDFLARARLALDTLRMLADGTLRMEATAIELTGHGTRSQIARALDLFDRLPDDMAAAIDLTPLDDGLPLGLTAEKSGGTVTLVGKMPFGTQAAALGLESFGEAMIVSEIDAKAANFLTTAQVGLSALTAFEDGKLVVQDAEEVDGPALLTLTGTVTRAGLQAVNAALGALPARVAPAIDVAFADDGTPLRLAAFWDGTRLEATGKLPFDADFEDLGLDAPGPALQIAEIDAQSAAFLDVVEDGLDALRALEEGSFNLADASDLGGAPSVTLAGVARTPVEERLARDALEDYDATLTITLLDDGAPPVFALSFNATTGAALTGKLPDGLSTSEFADALGIAAVETDVIEGLVGDADGLAEDIAALATWLPEVENLTLEYDGRRWTNFAITPLPGVNVGLLRNGLRADLGIRPTVSEGPPLSMGTERVNAATGQRERLTPSGWLRVFDFTPSLARCDEASAAILETAKITFLSSSSRLDARSLRAINALSGAVLHCLEALPMLTVEVGGHTDARGGAQGNLALSQNRANAVAVALIDRGVPADAVTAVGFGETQPIADNGTAEGRAQNRRTTLSWSANQ
ncbi:MAG: OmpA family protein, partial [Pseudomonadota bacterium]